ncbi:RRQRL motif-containing zinc-binding protein [Streptomyces sp. NPDC001828]|uniref:RRQRL motif-containing zinc-binding protein n=1 Tax=Streptomyces sp. NPDC001828 TaxID=3364615 RepID=UPI0036B71CD5
MSMAYAKCFDPDGSVHGIPTFPWRMAPDGLATRRQLRARGLRPGGQQVAAQVLRYTRRTGQPRVAYLYRIAAAKPVRPMTSRKWGALALAMLARRTCPKCRLTFGYVIPASLGMCVPCAYPNPSAEDPEFTP